MKPCRTIAKNKIRNQRKKRKKQKKLLSQTLKEKFSISFSPTKKYRLYCDNRKQFLSYFFREDLEFGDLDRAVIFENGSSYFSRKLLMINPILLAVKRINKREKAKNLNWIPFKIRPIPV